MSQRSRRQATLAAVLAASILAACTQENKQADSTYTISIRYCAADRFSQCNDPTQQATEEEFPQAYRNAFEQSRGRVESLITAGLVPVRTTRDGQPLECSDGDTLAITMDEEVHGLVILATLKSLGFGIVASSGPCIARNTSHLPLVAIMEFDAGTIAGYSDSGKLADVTFHEMLHTLGFGTIWDQFEPPLGVGAGTLDSAYTGAHALSTAQAENGAPPGWTSLPLETCGSAAPASCEADPGSSALCCSGTRDSHWENAAFGDEIMTAYVLSGDQPLSATTVAALRDMGYTVDLTAASVDPSFTIASAGLRALTSQPAVDLSRDVLRIPLQYADDGQGP